MTLFSGVLIFSLYWNVFQFKCLNFPKFYFKKIYPSKRNTGCILFVINKEPGTESASVGSSSLYSLQTELIFLSFGSEFFLVHRYHLLEDLNWLKDDEKKYSYIIFSSENLSYSKEIMKIPT